MTCGFSPSVVANVRRVEVCGSRGEWLSGCSNKRESWCAVLFSPNYCVTMKTKSSQKKKICEDFCEDDIKLCNFVAASLPVSTLTLRLGVGSEG
jgi:hypothetical protein